MTSPIPAQHQGQAQLASKSGLRFRRRKPWTVFRLFKYAIGLLFLMLAAIVALNFRPLSGPNQPALRVSPEITWITEPLKPNGDVDYVAYFNRLGSEGVTPETNAAVDFAAVLGPKAVSDRHRGSLYELLGCPAPPEHGNYLTEFDSWLRKNPQAFSEGFEPALAGLERVPLSIVLGEASFDPSRNPAISAWLAESDPHLDQIRFALRNKPDWYVPLTGKSSIDSETGGLLTGTVFAARVLQMSANRHLGTGRADLAVEDALSVLRLSRRRDKAESSQDHLIGTAWEGIGLVMVRQIVSSHLASYEQLIPLRDDFRNRVRREVFAPVMLQRDRVVLLETLVRAARGELDLAMLTEISLNTMGEEFKLRRQLFCAATDWYETGRQINECYDELVRSLEASGPDALIASVKRRQDEIKARGTDSDALTHLMAGRKGRAIVAADAFLGLTLDPVQNLIASARRNEADFVVVQAAIAAEMYRLKQGHWPDSLDALVPEFLPAVPADDFSGQPLVFRREGENCQVYSVGPDRVDNGGIEYGSGLNGQHDLCGFVDVPTLEEAAGKYRKPKKKANEVGLNQGNNMQ